MNWTTLRKDKRLTGWLLLLGIGCLVAYCMVETRTSPIEAARGLPNMVEYVRSMFPPAWAKIPSLLNPLAESLEIAVVSIFWAAIGALLLGLLAARNVNPWPPLYQGARMLLNLLRGIPSLLYALLFVSMVGLGPFPGVLGLVFHCVGAMGRYFAEAFEATNMEPIGAAKVDGASRLQIIAFVLIPDVFHLLVGYVLYYFEYCVRSSTMLGLVGAGGIGVPLLVSIRLFRPKEVSACMLLILATVFVLDRGSAMIRRRILGKQRSL